jgi:hypothetical protein
MAIPRFFIGFVWGRALHFAQSVNLKQNGANVPVLSWKWSHFTGKLALFRSLRLRLFCCLLGTAATIRQCFAGCRSCSIRTIVRGISSHAATRRKNLSELIQQESALQLL